MPKKTYTQINSITLAASSSSVTFSSIPQNFRDLVLVLAGTSSTSSDMQIRLNGDSGSNYFSVIMYGTGSGSGVSGSGNETFWGIGLINSTQTNAIVQFIDYSATDKHKTALNRENNSSYVFGQAIRWANTAAVTTILVQKASGTFDTGFTASLYGIEA
jgi:hypothetical protein